MTARIITGDCRAVLATMAANSIDACVTDPPYGLEFMGKEWDRLTRNTMRAASTADQNYRQKYDDINDPKSWLRDRPDIGGSQKYAKQMQAWHETWAREVYRVLKPGGHMLAFGGTRTHHRLMCAIEDAGFEIRDCLMFCFGSGFPKSLNVAKAIQSVICAALLRDVRHSIDTTEGYQCGCSYNCRQCGEPLRSAQVIGRDVEQARADVQEYSRPSEPSIQTLSDSEHRCTASCVGLSDHLATLDSQGHRVGDAWQLIQAVSSFLCPPCFARSCLGASADAEHLVGMDWSSIDSPALGADWAGAELLIRSWNMSPEPYRQYTIALHKSEGFGSALKPSYEPIVLARKPLIGSVAANVTAWGVGGLNIAGCRIGTDEISTHQGSSGSGIYRFNDGPQRSAEQYQEHTGRWPANLILDAESAAVLDELSGELHSAGPSQNGGSEQNPQGSIFGIGKATASQVRYGDSSGASRFFFIAKPDSESRLFYTAKASRAERNKGLAGMPERQVYGDADEWGKMGVNVSEFQKARGRSAQPTIAANHHPTVKPVDLMQWLVRLITPKGGTVLDCFCGSGTTGIAADREDMHFIGIEQDPEYAEIARRRFIGDCPLFAEIES